MGVYFYSRAFFGGWYNEKMVEIFETVLRPDGGILFPKKEKRI